MGSGHKRLYRIIDFRGTTDIPAKVATIEYDQNRTARIALLHYADGERRYILAPNGLEVGAKVVLGVRPRTSCRATRCRCARSRWAPRSQPRADRGKGGQLVRSAGTAAQLMAKEGSYAQVRPRRSPRSAHRLLRHDRPGRQPRARERLDRQGRPQPLMGWRPHNRGVSMNPVDHPMGGGEQIPQAAAIRPRRGLEDQGHEDSQQQAHRRIHRRRRKSKA
jgi:large subunit ribosomal protein L2